MTGRSPGRQLVPHVNCSKLGAIRPCHPIASMETRRMWARAVSKLRATFSQSVPGSSLDEQVGYATRHDPPMHRIDGGVPGPAELDLKEMTVDDGIDLGSATIAISCHGGAVRIGGLARGGHDSGLRRHRRSSGSRYSPAIHRFIRAHMPGGVSVSIGGPPLLRLIRWRRMPPGIPERGTSMYVPARLHPAQIGQTARCACGHSWQITIRDQVDALSGGTTEFGAVARCPKCKMREALIDQPEQAGSDPTQR